jgi:hypothetical protein
MNAAIPCSLFWKSVPVLLIRGPNKQDETKDTSFKKGVVLIGNKDIDRLCLGKGREGILRRKHSKAVHHVR